MGQLERQDILSSVAPPSPIRDMGFSWQRFLCARIAAGNSDLLMVSLIIVRIFIERAPEPAKKNVRGLPSTRTNSLVVFTEVTMGFETCHVSRVLSCKNDTAKS